MSSPTDTETVARPYRLPTGIRRAALVSLVLGGLMGLSAANEAASMTHLSSLREVSRPGPIGFGDPELARQVVETQLATQVAALEPMKVSRAVILAALALVAGLLFLSSARLLWPGGMPRDGMRALLGVSALAAAFLRTLDGAQLAVVAKKMAAAVTPVLSNAEPFRDLGPMVQPLATWTHVGGVAFFTGAMALTLVWLSSYFRSDRVKQIIAFADQQQR